MYKVKELAELSGVSPRTLRYYDKLGLLAPARVEANGYRLYGPAQVDRLQQILFYREMEFPLEEIAQILAAPDYDAARACREHLAALRRKKAQLESLIGNVEKTIRSMEGEETMSDTEKFEGFKQELIRENREKYGAEVAQRYGREAAAAADARVAGMSQQDWQKQQALTEELAAALRAGMAKGDPACAQAQRAADLHRQWLCMFWAKNQYTGAAHRGLAEMYVADPRFTAYYEQLAGPGAAVFLRDAIARYTAE